VDHARAELQPGAVLGQTARREWLAIDPDRDHSGELHHIDSTVQADFYKRVMGLHRRILNADASMCRSPNQVATRRQ
jgi:hypothetical protein